MYLSTRSFSSQVVKAALRVRDLITPLNNSILETFFYPRVATGTMKTEEDFRWAKTPFLLLFPSSFLSLTYIQAE
jgi:hypothetical protein